MVVNDCGMIPVDGMVCGERILCCADMRWFLWCAIKGVSEAIHRILAPLSVRTNFKPAHTLCKALVHVKNSNPLSRDLV